MKTKSIITILCVEIWCSDSIAASFPCEKASNTLEKTICADTNLSRIDEKMAEYYNTIKASLDASQSQNFLSEQRAWLKKRLEQCQASDVSCLHTLYSERIDGLRVRYESLAPYAIDDSAKDDLDFCNAFIQEDKPGIEWVGESPGNNAEINTYLTTNNIIFGGDRVKEYYNIDIDDDGNLENIVTGDAGSAQYRGLYIYDGDWKPKKYVVDITDNGAEYGGLFRYKNKIYITWDKPFLHWGHPRLNFVSSFKNGEYRFVCKYEYRSGAKEVVEYSKDKTLCDGVLDNKGAYAQFKIVKTLPPDRCYKTGGPACAKPQNDITVIDINNDGLEENVAKMGVNWEGGRGCEFTFLAITNDHGDAIQISDSNDALMKATQKWPDCGGAISSPFKYNDLWYIENKYPDNNVFNYHEVLLLKGNKVENVCRYTVAREPYVVR